MNHAVIQCDSDGVVLLDKGSLNKTKLNKVYLIIYVHNLYFILTVRNKYFLYLVLTWF